MGVDNKMRLGIFKNRNNSTPLSDPGPLGGLKSESSSPSFTLAHFHWDTPSYKNNNYILHNIEKEKKKKSGKKITPLHQ